MPTQFSLLSGSWSTTHVWQSQSFQLEGWNDFVQHGLPTPQRLFELQQVQGGIGKVCLWEGDAPAPPENTSQPSTKYWVPAGAQLSLWGSACSEPTSLGLFQGHFLLLGFSGSFHSVCYGFCPYSFQLRAAVLSAVKLASLLGARGLTKRGIRRNEGSCLLSSPFTLPHPCPFLGMPPLIDLLISRMEYQRVCVCVCMWWRLTKYPCRAKCWHWRHHSH